MDHLVNEYPKYFIVRPGGYRVDVIGREMNFLMIVIEMRALRVSDTVHFPQDQRYRSYTAIELSV